MRSTRGSSDLKLTIRVSDDCNLCGLCEQYCPAGVFRVVDARLQVDESRCVYCKGCEILCPLKAIRVEALDEDLVVIRRTSLFAGRT